MAETLVRVNASLQDRGKEVLRSASVRVAVFAGPSGGHLFPAVSFNRKFRESFPRSQIYLVTSRKAEKLLHGRWGAEFDGVHYLPPFPWPSRWDWHLVPFLIRLGQSFWISERFLKKIRPGLAVGFGSYASLPGMMLCAWRKIPTMIHEQNFTAGKATRWLSRYVDCVTSSFPNTFDFVPYKGRHHVGLPVRFASQSLTPTLSHPPKDGRIRPLAEREREKNDLPLSPTGRGQGEGLLFRLLVLGGSQGSHRINEVILQALSQFRDEEKKNLAVKHITGLDDQAWVSEEYRRLKIQARTYSFFDDMEQLYMTSDMAITRAGANTLFELAFFKLPAIVIPYPHAGAHQSANARYFQDAGAVFYQEEKTLTPDWLCRQIRGFMKDQDLIRKMSGNISRLATPQAQDLLVLAAEQLITRSLHGEH